LFACTSSKVLGLQMLPSSEMAAGVVDSKLAEPHLKLLISHLPVLLSCVTHDWTIRLLQVWSSVELLACNNCSMNDVLPICSYFFWMDGWVFDG
jgi:hypothetical protein